MEDLFRSGCELDCYFIFIGSFIGSEFITSSIYINGIVLLGFQAIAASNSDIPSLLFFLQQRRSEPNKVD